LRRAECGCELVKRPAALRLKEYEAKEADLHL
jgi:hypothetical protein